MQPRSRSLALTSVALVALSAAYLGSQPATPPSASQQDPQGQQPIFRTAANYVRVDVYPTAIGKIVPDLTQADFEVFEDGRPQKVDTFEHVVFRAPGPETERRDPTTVRESNDAAADPRRGGQQTCDTDRQVLAEMDNERAFVEMLDDASRANVTFYPIDPRGLPAGSDRPARGGRLGVCDG